MLQVVLLAISTIMEYELNEPHPVTHAPMRLNELHATTEFSTARLNFESSAHMDSSSRLRSTSASTETEAEAKSEATKLNAMHDPVE